MKLTILIFTTLTFAASISALPTDSKRSGSPLTQSTAQSRLQSAGIYAVSSGGCTTKSNPSCTSYEGILSGTVDGAITLKTACACDVTVTGGTEMGHASGTYSHANGYKLDFRKNTALNGYVTGSFTRIGDRGDGYPQWQSAAGNIYCDEGNHWDVLYY